MTTTPIPESPIEITEDMARAGASALHQLSGCRSVNYGPVTEWQLLILACEVYRRMRALEPSTPEPGREHLKK